MSSSNVLTSDAILAMVHSLSTGTMENVSHKYIQLILVEESTMQSGSKKYMVIISNGTDCLDCCVVPML
jgi:hypothetical protein